LEVIWIVDIYYAHVTVLGVVFLLMTFHGLGQGRSARSSGNILIHIEDPENLRFS